MTEDEIARLQVSQDQRWRDQMTGYTAEQQKKVADFIAKNAGRWALPTSGNLALDDYRRSKEAYGKAARGGITGYTPAVEGTGWGENYMPGVGGNEPIYGNMVGSENLWDKDWASSLTPQQAAEFHRLSEIHDDKIQGRMKLAALGSLGAIAGAGALGAGMFGSGGVGAGALGGAAGAGEASAGLGMFIPGVDSAAASAAGGFSGLGSSAIPSAINLGSLGGIMETGSGVLGAGAGGLGSFIPGVDSAASGYGFASEIPAWAQGSAGAGWTGGIGSTVGNSLSGSIGEYLKSLGASAAKDVGGNWLSQLISSGTNAYMGNKSAGQYNDVLNEINALYSPNSPYALQMKQALARKDAAAGRNSQYGTREVELAAALTNSKANALTSAGYGNLMNQRGISQNIPWNGFLAALGSGPGQELITKAGGNIGGWLGGLFGNSGDKLVPTQPNSTPNWWENWGGYTNGGP